MSDSTLLATGRDTFLRRPIRLSAPGIIAIACGALASYAIFRAAANARMIPAIQAALVDAICFAAADASLIVLAYLASRATRDDSATRRAWMLILAAAICSGIGSSAATVNEIMRPGTVVSLWVDAFFWIAYAFTIAGLLSFPSAPRERAERITLSFDVATVALGGVMVLWYWCERAGGFPPTTSLVTKAIVIGYPTADIVVLVTATILLVRSSDDRSRTIFGFIAIATLLSAIADFWYGYLTADVLKYQRSTVMDVCWFGGVLLLSVAAATQLSPAVDPDRRDPAARRWMAEIPLIAVGLAFAMLFLAIRENRENVEVQLGVGALVMTVLAIARQRISARDAARLMSERATHDARFRALVQHSIDVVIVLDASLRATYVSPAIEGVLGLDSEMLVGSHFLKWVAPADAGVAAADLARAAQTSLTTEPLRYHMVHADGSLRMMETIATNLLGDPAVRGIVLNSRDITRRTALEVQVQHTQKLEVVGQLAGGIAHDFNNLLMVIGANADFVLSDDGDLASRHEAAMEIKETTKRAAALTKQLLAFSRRQESRPVLTDPNEIVRHVERMLVRLMQHSAVVQTDLTATPLAISIDPGQLEQALLNLAVNARDAMPAGGVICIRTRHVTIADFRTVDCGILTPGDYVAMSVEDNGAGMRADVRSRIFEPFFTTKPIGAGTGLGLAMVLGVVHQANGQVQVDSAPEKGTCITLYFPFVARSDGDVTARPQSSAMRGTGRILVVDDEEGVRMVLQRLLRRIGYEVDAVGDANTALAMLAVAPLRFDLVLSDILMPEKTGLELATELIAAKVPVSIVLMTGFADSETVRETSQLHALPVLRKPFEVDQLAVMVEEALAQRFRQPIAG